MLVIKNGRLLTMACGVIDGDIAIDKGKILKIGKVDITAADRVIDGSGKVVMPGIVDAHCHIGMWEDGIGFEGADGNESTDPITPQLRAIDGINPMDHCFFEAYTGGVTSVLTGPGSANVLGGQFVAMKTYGRRIDDMIIKAPAAVKAAFGENPKRVYNEQEKTPMTRMATASLLRTTLIEAQEYAKKLKLAEKDEEKRPDRDLKLEALVPVLKGELPLKAHAHRADDILTAIRIAKEFNIRLTIEHCTEGHLIADILKEEQAGIILGPLITERCKVELKNLTLKAPKILRDAGIKFAIMSDHPVVATQNLLICAALAVREGLDEDTALKAITIHAAEITGIADRVGSLEVGKDADIAVFSGNPLELRSRCECTIIDGNIVHNLL